MTRYVDYVRDLCDLVERTRQVTTSSVSSEMSAELRALSARLEAEEIMLAERIDDLMARRYQHRHPVPTSRAEGLSGAWGGRRLWERAS